MVSIRFIYASFWSLVEGAVLKYITKGMIKPEINDTKKILNKNQNTLYNQTTCEQFI